MGHALHRRHPGASHPVHAGGDDPHDFTPAVLQLLQPASAVLGSLVSASAAMTPVSQYGIAVSDLPWSLFAFAVQLTAASNALSDRGSWHACY